MDRKRYYIVHEIWNQIQGFLFPLNIKCVDDDFLV